MNLNLQAQSAFAVAHIIDVLPHFAFNKINFNFIRQTNHTHVILLTRRTLLTFLSGGGRRIILILNIYLYKKTKMSVIRRVG